MVKHGIRHCDICDHEIAKGETYLVTKIDKSYFPKGVNVAGSGFTMDSLRNVYMEICMDCRRGMSLRGEEMVN